MYSRVKVKFNTDAVVDEIKDKVLTPDTLTEINQTLADMCDPYVPYQTGNLAHDITVTDKGITYNAPYATKQYILPDHSKNIHPLASGQWDKAMMDAEGDTFVAKVEQILSDKLRQS